MSSCKTIGVNNVETIISCKIGPYPKGILDPIPIVTVTLTNGEVKELFAFYPDEISFTEGEFIGLTVDQAFELKHKKDVKFLQT